jgi:hypothetical protein
MIKEEGWKRREILSTKPSLAYFSGGIDDFPADAALVEPILTPGRTERQQVELVISFLSIEQVSM